jgi:hypothetical protein
VIHSLSEIHLSLPARRQEVLGSSSKTSVELGEKCDGIDIDHSLEKSKFYFRFKLFFLSLTEFFPQIG